eukprot:COSAG04_NODE_606_length_12113_cov_13.437073_1_plen_220_part_10
MPPPTTTTAAPASAGAGAAERRQANLAFLANVGHDQRAAEMMAAQAAGQSRRQDEPASAGRAELEPRPVATPRAGSAVLPEPLPELVRTKRPGLRGAVEEWRRSELEMDIEEERRRAESLRVRAWLGSVGLGGHGAALERGRFCGPRCLQQLQQLQDEELKAFCEDVSRQHVSRGDEAAQLRCESARRCKGCRGVVGLAILAALLVGFLGCASHAGCAM